MSAVEGKGDTWRAGTLTDGKTRSRADACYSMGCCTALEPHSSHSLGGLGSDYEIQTWWRSSVSTLSDVHVRSQLPSNHNREQQETTCLVLKKLDSNICQVCSWDPHQAGLRGSEDDAYRMHA